MQVGHSSFLDFEEPKMKGLDTFSLLNDFDNMNEIE
jgi:hypothetical protein